MEEVVGEFWHRLVTKHASTDYDDVRVELLDLQSQLGPFYRALGGSAAKVIEAAAPRKFNADRNFLQRLAGTHKRMCVAWQDERSVRLAPDIAFFQSKELNEKLYFWQVAMAAYLPKVSHWFSDNQNASLKIITVRPGLKLIYEELVEEVLKLRPNLEKLEGDKHSREIAIRQALQMPGTVKILPKAAGDALPVPLWLYPEAMHGVNAMPLDDGEEEVAASHAGLKKIKVARKESQRTNDAKKTDGLLVFMLESIFSWTEHVSCFYISIS
jgi:nitric oxide reductase NorD protein